MRKLLKSIICLGLALGMWSSCTHPAWEDHYNASSVNVIDKTLKEALQADPDLSQFVAYLEEMDYLDAFGHSQSYTIWAPTNEAWEGFDASDKRNLLQTLKNHVSRYPYLTTDVTNEDIELRLMDNKRVKFHRQGEAYYFGAQALDMSASDVAYKNGILHKIGGVEPYIQNIYEYIQFTPNLDSLNTFIASYHIRRFSPEQSLVLGVNEEGETVYDSVFSEYNYLLADNYLGELNNEETSYTALLPTNKAWNDMYARLYPYLSVSPFTLPIDAPGGPYKDELLADSTRDLSVKHFMMDYLVFKGAMTPEQIQQKGLTYTQGGFAYVKDMAYYFEGAYDTYTELSNGVAYTTDHLKLDPTYWCQTHTIEAEQFYNHYYVPNTYLANPDSMTTLIQKQEENARNLNRRDTQTSWMDSVISNSAYLEVFARSSQIAPTIAFDLSGQLLSNVGYNIKVVFLPEHVFDKNKFDRWPYPKAKSVPVRFALSYLNEDGGVNTLEYRDVHYTDPLHADTVLVNADGPIRVPFAQSLASVKVISDIKPLEDSVYSRNMNIDCIILEPVF
ncbi:MAG: fasciclin domain-containing protein [Bacteroidales bacterium]|nr:fasciclin domain-containing protein [Bacteroidales bacterium]